MSICQCYNVTFFDNTIKTLVTADPCIVDGWISTVKRLYQQYCTCTHELVLGLDVEWRPNRNIQAPVATLQLCDGHSFLIFQIMIASEIPQSLRDLFFDDHVRFVGVGVDNDTRKLFDDYGLQLSNRVRTTVDLRGFAATCLGDTRLRNAGLVSLARVVLGRNFEKPRRVTLSDWDAVTLSFDQIEYACIDAFVSIEIWRCLINAGD